MNHNDFGELLNPDQGFLAPENTCGTNDIYILCNSCFLFIRKY